MTTKRTNNKDTIKKPVTKKVCSRCTKEQSSANFYNTSDVDFFPDKKIPVCKTCCLQITEEKGFEGFQTLMRLINKPIYQDLYKNDVGDYIRMMNSMPQYKSVTFMDSSSFRENKALEINKRAKPKELTEEDLRNSEDFFGTGMSEESYIWLNMEYSDYLSRYEVDSKTMENLIREICLTQLDIRNKRADRHDVKNELKTYNDLLTAANLKPVQETGANSVDQETFGTLIKKWENERPIPEPEDDWKENDRVGKYLKVWFTGHLMRMFGLENKDEEEYFEEINKYTVKSEETDDIKVLEGEDDGRI